MFKRAKMRYLKVIFIFLCL